MGQRDYLNPAGHQLMNPWHVLTGDPEVPSVPIPEDEDVADEDDA